MNALSLLVRAPLIVAATVLFGSISLAASLLDSEGVLQHRCARMWARAVLRLAGVELGVRGGERLGSVRGSILCVNHQSDMDIPVLLAALPFPFRFAAKKSLFRVPFLGWHLRRAGHVAIDRENPRAAIRALDQTVERVRGGLPLVVFPEGRISQDGRLADFRRGAFLLARRTGANLVPVTILGARAVLGPSSWTLRPGPIEVTLGEPIAPEEAALSELASRVRTEVQTQGTTPLADGER